MSRSTSAFLSLVASPVFLAASAAFAASPVWVPLGPNSPPGTPATVVLDAAGSNGNETWVDIRIHGYWQTTILAPDGLKYQKIEVPGLGRIGQSGAPDLPAVRLRIAYPTTAPVLDLVSAQVMTSTTANGVRVYPFPVEELDDPPDPSGDPGPGDPDGTPEQFMIDPAIYGLATSWPPSAGTDLVPTQAWLGQVRSAGAEVYPVRCIPSGLGMGVTFATWLRCHYIHIGTASVQPKITKDLEKLCVASIFNWSELGSWFQADTTTYKGRYLFIVPNEYSAALQPLVDHRKACGYATTTMQLGGSFPFSCQGIRNIIADWLDDGLPSYDHYCLLVGDTNKIPLCPSPAPDVKYGDDPYGSPVGIADLDEEVFVGRLSVDSSADLTAQIVKILNYELHPKVGGLYGKALLVAHKQDAPLKYQGNCETVAADPGYTVPLFFAKRYGATPGVDNADVIADIENGVGVVSYRGHGSSNTWADWNLAGESFHKNDVVALEDQPFFPIAWAFTCTNQNVDHGGGTVDSIGENWLETPYGGSVAHYGATSVSETEQNHILHHEMFRAVYKHGVTTHAQAMALAEHKLVSALPGLNSWLYLLLGDPVMKVRRKTPLPPVVDGPDSITASPNPQSVSLQVKDENGTPLSGVLVSLYKPKWPPVAGGATELLANGYSGTSGVVVLPLGPTSFGTINTIGRDDDGNVATGTIKVDSGPWTDLGGGKYGGNGLPMLGGSGTLKAKTANSVDLYLAPPNRPAILFVSLADSPQPFLGGTLHAAPVALALDAFSDVEGRILLPVVSWPSGVPSGTTLVMQYAIDDPAASFGVGLSNGLRAITP